MQINSIIIDPMSSSLCQHRTLAQNGVAQIQHCALCGCISIHLGVMTLRVDANGLEALWAVPGEAAVALHTEREREPVVGGTA